MKKILLSAVAIAAIAAIAPATAQNAVSTPGASVHHPKAMKTVTRAGVAQKVQQHFAKLDSDGDGYVSKAEADAARASMGQRAHQRMQKRGTTMFERIDTNKDGVLTRAEAEAVFAKGQVDIAHAGPGDKQPRHNWDALVSRFDTNKDGAISRAEFDSGHAQHAQNKAQRRPAAGMRHAGMAGPMFERADANNDGRVSLQEATSAALAHFDAADTNRDGTLTHDEMRQGRHKMKTTEPRR
jgi:Ca2+-binding EF-hand superfamily protein